MKRPPWGTSEVLMNLMGKAKRLRIHVGEDVEVIKYVHGKAK